MLGRGQGPTTCPANGCFLEPQAENVDSPAKNNNLRLCMNNLKQVFLEPVSMWVDFLWLLISIQVLDICLLVAGFLLFDCFKATSCFVSILVRNQQKMLWKASKHMTNSCHTLHPNISKRHTFRSKILMLENWTGSWPGCFGENLRPKGCVWKILSQYGEFHSHGGSTKWLVYNGKSHQNGWFGGTPYFRKPPYVWPSFSNPSQRIFGFPRSDVESSQPLGELAKRVVPSKPYSWHICFIHSLVYHFIPWFETTCFRGPRFSIMFSCMMSNISINSCAVQFKLSVSIILEGKYRHPVSQLLGFKTPWFHTWKPPELHQVKSSMNFAPCNQSEITILVLKSSYITIITLSLFADLGPGAIWGPRPKCERFGSICALRCEGSAARSAGSTSFSRNSVACAQTVGFLQLF